MFQETSHSLVLKNFSVINNFDTVKIKKSPVLSTTLLSSIIPAASISQVPGTGPSPSEENKPFLLFRYLALRAFLDLKMMYNEQSLRISTFQQ